MIIVKITRQERDYLLKKGVCLNEGGITKTTSRHSGITYFLCESYTNIKLLREARKNHVVYTYDGNRKKKSKKTK